MDVCGKNARYLMGDSLLLASPPTHKGEICTRSLWVVTRKFVYGLLRILVSGHSCIGFRVERTKNFVAGRKVRFSSCSSYCFPFAIKLIGIMSSAREDFHDNTMS